MPSELEHNSQWQISQHSQVDWLIQPYIFQFFVYKKEQEGLFSEDILCLINFDKNYQDHRLNIEQLSKKEFIGKEIEKNTIAMKDKIKKIFNLSLGG